LNKDVPLAPLSKSGVEDKLPESKISFNNSAIVTKLQNLEMTKSLSIGKNHDIIS